MGSGYSQLSSKNLTKEQLLRMEQKFKRLSGGNGRASIEEVMLLVSRPERRRHWGPVNTHSLLLTRSHPRSLSWQATPWCRACLSCWMMGTAPSPCRGSSRLYDLDQDGSISAQELYSMLQQILGEGVSDQQLGRVVEATLLQYDTDGDWCLDFQEFVVLMNRVDLYSKFTFTVC